MKTQTRTKIKLTGDIAMYRNTLESGHKIDGRKWQGKEVIKQVKEMDTDPCEHTRHSATKYLSVKDHRTINNISLN